MLKYVILLAAVSAGAAEKPSAPTYSRDIAPILNSNCVSCHRPGEIGPMPLTSYKEVRPFAKAIKEEVAERKMPPWHADPKIGHFKNARRLSDDQVRAIVRWADGGAPEGNRKDLPPPPKFVEGWMEGKPDAEFTIPKTFEVPSEGVVDYQYMITPTNLTEDKWVSVAEIRPGNREVLHHVIVFLLPPDGTPPAARRGSRFGTSCPQSRPTPEQIKQFMERQKLGREPREMGVFLAGWAPGLAGMVAPEGAAWHVPAGSRLMFQLHYTPRGKAAVDKDTKIGFTYAKGEVRRTLHTLPIMNQQFVIPPEEPNYEATSCFTFSREVTLLDFMPHMHYRGKDFTYKLTLPDGRSETLLSVPRYDFNWQTWYRRADPLVLPAGSRIDCTAHWDNSARNSYNPDPKKEVRWGDQSFEEMMIGYVTVAADREAPPARAAGQ